jgi:hypothetical protein
MRISSILSSGISRKVRKSSVKKLGCPEGAEDLHRAYRYAFSSFYNF